MDNKYIWTGKPGAADENERQETAGEERMKIYLMTDMEGCAGILDFENWVFPQGRYYDKGKRLLTLEVNAVCRGFFDAGADEILVVDGHGHGGIDPELLDGRLQLLRGVPDPVWPYGLDASFDAFACVGQHAKAGTPLSHLTHTSSPMLIDETVNGLSIGEYGQMALCARELGIPSIFAAGEQALTEEAIALTPGIVTVSVKRGLLPDDGMRELTTEQYRRAKLSAVHLAPRRARALLYDGAFRAVKKFLACPADFRYPDLAPPYEIRMECRRDEEHDTPYFLVRRHPDSFIGAMNTKPEEPQKQREEA